MPYNNVNDLPQTAMPLVPHTSGDMKVCVCITFSSSSTQPTQVAKNPKGAYRDGVKREETSQGWDWKHTS